MVPSRLPWVQASTLILEEQRSIWAAVSISYGTLASSTDWPGVTFWSACYKGLVRKGLEELTSHRVHVFLSPEPPGAHSDQVRLEFSLLKPYNSALVLLLHPPPSKIETEGGSLFFFSLKSLFGRSHDWRGTLRYYTSIRGRYSPNDCSFFSSRGSTARLMLKSGAWTPGCSLPGSHGYGEACKNPGMGPGSPLPPEASGPDCAASRRTDGCGFYEPVRYGSFHQRASGCDVPPANDPSLYGCCCGFFVPVWGGKYWFRTTLDWPINRTSI